jgi:hypothetical protein
VEALAVTLVPAEQALIISAEAPVLVVAVAVALPVSALVPQQELTAVAV